MKRCVQLKKNIFVPKNNNVALCISGYPNETIIEQLKLFQLLCSNVDVFFFFWDVVGDNIKKEIVSILNPVAYEFGHPIGINVEPTFKEPDKQESKIKSFQMFYGISQVQKIRKEYEIKTHKKYDIVIRIRFDLFFFDDLFKAIESVYSTLDGNIVYFPWERHFFGMCDQIWFANSVMMDKFIGLYNWVVNNCKDIYYVNENVLYKFLIANDIDFNCVDLRYVIVRDSYLHSPNIQSLLKVKYKNEKKESWISECQVRKNDCYKKYISLKNESGNIIYFLTDLLYIDVKCKLFSVFKNRYLRLDGNNFVGDVHHSPLTIRVYNAYLINIILDTQMDKTEQNNVLFFENIDHGSNNLENAQSMQNKNQNMVNTTQKKYLSIDNNNKLCLSNVNTTPNTQFYISKKGKNYCLIPNVNLENPVYLYMDQFERIHVCLESDIDRINNLTDGLDMKYNRLHNDMKNDIKKNPVRMSLGFEWKFVKLHS